MKKKLKLIQKFNKTNFQKMKMKRTSFFQILVISCLFLTFFIVNEVDGAKLVKFLFKLDKIKINFFFFFFFFKRRIH